MPLSVAYRWLLGFSRVLERTTRWLLTNQHSEPQARAVRGGGPPGSGRLREAFPEIVTGKDKQIFERLARS
jgi:hypothetical protein